MTWVTIAQNVGLWFVILVLPILSFLAGALISFAIVNERLQARQMQRINAAYEAGYVKGRKIAFKIALSRRINKMKRRRK